MADTVIAFPSHQLVAPYEANLVAQAEQKRFSVAAPAAATLAGLRSRINRIDHGLVHHARELADAWAEAGEGSDPPFFPAMPTWAYWTGVMLLLCLEMALNMAAVEQLRMTPLHAWATAAFIGVVNCSAAKTSARVLRQQCWKDGGHPAWLIALVANAVIILALWQLADIRSAAAASEAAEATSALVSVSGEMASDVPSAAGVPTAAASPLVFLLLQLGGYVAVLLLSYFQLDRSPAREQLRKRIAHLEARVATLWSQREASARRHNRTLALVGLALDDIAADAAERVFQYRDANMRARSDGPPAYFAQAIFVSAFKPIELGTMIDHHPLFISDLIKSSQKESNHD